MVCTQTSAVRTDQYRMVFKAIDMRAPEEEKMPPIEGPRLKNLQVGGTPVTMTVDMVAGLIPGDSPARKLFERGPDSMDYELAATALLTLSWDARLLEQVDEAGWFDVPLSRWVFVFKDKLAVVRRVGMFGSFVGDGVYALRKLLNVTYRRDTEADWEKEKHNRRCWESFKCMPSGADFDAEFYKKALELSREVAGRVAARSDSKGFVDWWMRRQHHIPGGSTSCGQWARKLFEDDARFGDNDRPTKKSVFEALDANAMSVAIKSPPSNWARASTKAYEPGDKRRALYASNEIPYLISSWASVHAEKESSKWGSRIRQSPEDFRDWLVDTVQKRTKYWISLDMSDYNKQHMLRHLALLYLARARANAELGDMEKAGADVWLAESMMNSYVQWPDGEETRVFVGLFSGHRNTARDNTDIHAITVQLALDEMRRLGYPAAPEAVHIAGDDEDTAWGSLVETFVYSSVTYMMGNDMNSIKMLAGEHEFLQVSSDSATMMHRPLAALLATLSSGNWYRPSATWYDSIIGGISDNWWEAVARGLPQSAAFYMACRYLNVVMRVRDQEAGKWVELEWWKYRSPGRVHPLWGVETGAAPVTRSKPRPRKTWPCRATEDWLAVHKKVLAGVKPEKVELYREDLLMDSHGSAFLRHRQTVLAAEVLDKWPARRRMDYVEPRVQEVRGFSAEEMAACYMALGVSKAPRTDGELASRLGMDPQIVGLVGGWKQLAQYCDGTAWANYMPVLPKRGLTLKAALSPWGFRTYAAQLEASVPWIHVGVVAGAYTRLVYVYAPNGSGKGWLVSRHDNWVELDTYGAKYAAVRPPRARGLARWSERVQFMMLVLRGVVKDRIEVVLGQYPVEDVQRAAAALGIAVKSVAFFPPEATLVKRLTERGWSPDKIERRRSWWIHSPGEFTEPEELERHLGYTPAEKRMRKRGVDVGPFEPAAKAKQRL